MIDDYSKFFTGSSLPKSGELDAARERYLENVYTEFLKPVIEEHELFQPWELEEEIRPPYTTREIYDALEHVDDPEIELVEEDLWLWKYSGRQE